MTGPREIVCVGGVLDGERFVTESSELIGFSNTGENAYRDRYRVRDGVARLWRSELCYYNHVRAPGLCPACHCATLWFPQVWALSEDGVSGGVYMPSMCAACGWGGAHAVA